MEKLTLRDNQVDRARKTVAYLRDEGVRPGGFAYVPGYSAWLDDEREQESDTEWADALEDAIKRAEGTTSVEALPLRAPTATDDERAFWREACLRGLSPGFPADQATTAADHADVVLDRYRKAFGRSKDGE